MLIEKHNNFIFFSQFQENEKKMRDISHSILKSQSNNSITASGVSTAEAKHTTGPENDETVNYIDNPGFKDEKENIKIDFSNAQTILSKKPLPAWAVTENIAKQMADVKIQQEEEELLSFAKQLDYDKYIGDIEVQLMIDRLRRRIVELEKDVEQEDLREADAEVRAARKEMLELMVFTCDEINIDKQLLCVYDYF